MDEVPQVVVVGAACRDLVDDDPARLAAGRRRVVRGARARAARAAGRGARRRGRRGRVDRRRAAAGAGGRRGPPVRARRPRARSSSTSRRPPGASSARRRCRTRWIPRPCPTAWRSAGAWMFAPVAAEVRDEWADVPPEGALVAVGWQGLLRVLDPGEPVERHPPGPVAYRPAGGPRRGRPGRRRARDAAGSPARAPSPGRHDAVHRRGARGRRLHRGRAAVRPAGEDVGEHPDPPLRGPGRRGRHVPRRACSPPGSTRRSRTGTTGPDPDLRLGAACASLILEGPGMFAVPQLDDAVRRMHGVT